GARDLGHRIAPVAAQLHDFRVPQQAVASVRDDLRLRVAPSAEGVGPFAGSSHVEGFVAGLERDAVRNANALRLQLVACAAGHRVVEQLVAAGEITPSDEGASLAEPGEHNELDGSEAAADRGSVREVDERLLEVALARVTDPSV